MSTQRRDPMTEEEAIEIIERYHGEFWTSPSGYQYSKTRVCIDIANRMHIRTPDDETDADFKEAVEESGYHYVEVPETEYWLWWEAQTTHAETLMMCGKLYLDENYPDWRDRVNVQYLDMRGGTSCIIGQVFGDYPDGIRAIYEREMSKGIDLELSEGSWARDHGFIDDGACYAALDAVWHRALTGAVA